MGQVTVAGFFALLLLTSAGCSGSDRVMSQMEAGVTDRAPTPGAAAGDGARADAAIDLHFLLIAAILETERSLVARCPCLTASDVYENMSDCLSSMSLGRSWVDCANRLDLSAFDGAATRENLHCNIAQLTQRTECLMASACDEGAIARCMTQSLGCAVLPWQIFSAVASECAIAFSR